MSESEKTFRDAGTEVTALPDKNPLGGERFSEKNDCVDDCSDSPDLSSKEQWPGQSFLVIFDVAQRARHAVSSRIFAGAA
ncbi:MAG: hypothetical protein ACRELY_32745 [Polyangiaceae bacterium]